LGINLGKVGDFFGWEKRVYVFGGLERLIDISKIHFKQPNKSKKCPINIFFRLIVI